MFGPARGQFDVVVIGGGHAGCEAFAATSRLGVRVALVTADGRAVGFQPCNPAVGGPGKGHLVREVVALGGMMGRVTDSAGIQFRTLNRKKGPAVRSTRVQTDSAAYVENMRAALLACGPAGTIIQAEAVAIDFSKDGKNRRVEGVVLEGPTGRTTVATRCVVVAAGTFLRGKLFVGDEVEEGGRRGASASVSLARALEEAGLPLIRLKTGTCPRLAGSSIDNSVLEEQPGEDPPPFFDPETKSVALPQRSCHLTYTGARTHEIIRENLERSSLYGGAINGIGPRYCPSIETKIERFPEKERHQVFLEPEDQGGEVIYPSGLSTSLPRDVQQDLIRSIPGLEKAEIVRYGYAVEYDAFNPSCVLPSLEVDSFSGLYLAGQILGTSGYEEAAALGLVAGANAALSVRDEAPLALARGNSYTGVMIDDLTGKGIDEPYRMFTSRAEYRLILREDNADRRMLDEGARTGLISPGRAQEVRKKDKLVNDALHRLEREGLNPSMETNARLEAMELSPIKKPTSFRELAVRRDVSFEHLGELAPWLLELSELDRASVETEVKYSGYLERQRAQARALEESDSVSLPGDMDYDGIPGLRGELVEKLKSHRPATLGQASRIPGMTPAAISILRIMLKKSSA